MFQRGWKWGSKEKEEVERKGDIGFLIMLDLFRLT
jgi:hypothetical protein